MSNAIASAIFRRIGECNADECNITQADILHCIETALDQIEELPDEQTIVVTFKKEGRSEPLPYYLDDD